MTGAGGGVGTMAAQIAQAVGARVLGTASSAKRAVVESLGAVHVESGDGAVARVRAAAPEGVDAILDLVGGDHLRAVVGCLADRSRRSARTTDAGSAS